MVGMTYVAAGEVTTLKHELRNHTMETGTSVALTLLLCSTELTEVLSGLGNDVIVELEVDTAGLI